MLGTLLAKDLRRARRNPVPYLVQLCVPLVITALLGLVFGGGGSDAQGLGRIKFAVVDEDDSLLGSLLRGAGNQGAGGKFLEPIVLPRDEALLRITNNQLSAALIIPTNFTRHYLAGRDVQLTLVKNPAQSFHPAILEELLGAGATGLDALQCNFRDDLVGWNELIAGDRDVTWREIGDALSDTGKRLELVGRRLTPLPVWYEQEKQPEAAGGGGTGGTFNVFAFILPGLAAMFLLFLADVAMRDLQREVRQGTFQRFCTLPAGPALFVASKIAFTFLVVLLGAAIILGGGTALFGIGWKQPLALALLTLALALFSAGLLAALAAVIGGDRRAEVITSMFLMLLGLGSGCAFPAQSLPAFLREQILPLLPPAWFVGAARALQLDDATTAAWVPALVKLTVAGLLLGAGAAWGFRRRLRRGVL
jgi:ABC-type multidrug transport system permease subunit